MNEHYELIMNLKEKALNFLSNSDWNNADKIAEEILDVDNQNFDAYLIKVMAELKVSAPDNLGDLDEKISGYNYKKALLYADKDQKNNLKSCNIRIQKRQEEKRLESAYQIASQSMRNAKNVMEFEKTIILFKECIDYKDSAQLISKCNIEINELKYKEAKELSLNPNRWKDAINCFTNIRGYKDSENRIALLTQAIIDAENKRISDSADYDFNKAQRASNLDRKISLLRSAADGYMSLTGYPEAETKYNKCLEQINFTELQIQRKKQIQKKIKIGLILTAIAAVVLTAAYLLHFQYVFKYNRAKIAISADAYKEAVTILTELNDFSDSREILNEYKEKLYIRGVTADNEENYSSAIDLFSTIKGYKDSDTLLQKNIKLQNYDLGVVAIEEDDYAEAVYYLSDLNIKDSDTILETYRNKRITDAFSLAETKQYDEAYAILKIMNDDEKALNAYNEIQKAEKYDYLCDAIKNDDYIMAVGLMADLSAFRDSDVIFKDFQNTRIEKAKALGAEKKYDDAYSILNNMYDCEPAAVLLKEIQSEEKYESALAAIKNDDYITAVKLIEELDGYSDSQVLLADYQQRRIADANDMATDGDYDGALAILNIMTDCADAQDTITKINNQKIYSVALAYENSADYISAYNTFSEISSYLDSDSHLAALENKIAELATDAAVNKNIDSLAEYISCIGCAKLSEPMAILKQESVSHYAELENKISELSAKAVENKDIDALVEFVECVGDKITDQIFTLDNESIVLLFQSLSLEDAVQLIASTNSINLVSLWSELNPDIVYNILENLPNKNKVEILQRLSPAEASEYLTQFQYEKQAELLNTMSKTFAIYVLNELDTEKINNIIYWLDNRLIGLYINQSVDKNTSFGLINQFDYTVRTDILQNVSLGIVIDYLWTQTEGDRKALLQNLNLESLNYIFVEPKDMIEFGSYVQNESSPEHIEWIVLENTRNNVRLLSYDALDCVPYNKIKKEISWENSYIRQWLNDTFLKKAFSEDEQEMLIYTSNEAIGSAATEDRVYLLSCDEYSTYLNNTSFKSAVPTNYAKKQGAKTGFLSVNTKWWLRDSGSSATKAAAVHPNGSLDKSGEDVDQKTRGVRPAININLTSMLNDDELSSSINDSKFIDLYGSIANSDIMADYKSVTDSFRNISGYRDSDYLLEAYQNGRYNKAIQEGEAGNYDEAMSLLADMFDYEDSERKWNIYSNLKNKEISCIECN